MLHISNVTMFPTINQLCNFLSVIIDTFIQINYCVANAVKLIQRTPHMKKSIKTLYKIL